MATVSEHSVPPSPAGHLLDRLNEAQREAVEAVDGPVLVLAGAGTGKTRVLTVRLAHILATRRAAPGQILAATFTNKAAREMSERVAGLIGRPTEGMWLGTFHAIGARILRRHAEMVGLRSNFTIIDTDDQHRLMKQVIEASQIDEKRWPGRVLAAIVSRWKDKGWTPDQVPAGDVGDFAHGKGVELYRDYQQRLGALNAVDFGDLLLLCLDLFLRHPDVLADYHRRFRYILVDEYQDTNVSQYLWLRLLAQGSNNICCVGDDDQSIYGWRGAEVGNILRFEQDFPGATVVRLERNYRSTPHILGAASGLIANNRGRLGKTLWTEAPDNEMGEPVKIRGVWDEAEEARTVGETIEDLQRTGDSLDEMAILVRAGYQTRAFEERLITIGVPYRVIGGLRFYERQEIRDANAYFRLIRQGDDDLAFQRIVNTPKRGLGDKSIQTLYAIARGRGQSLLSASEGVVTTDELPPQRRTALREFVEAIGRWRAEASRLPPSELARIVLDESGYTAMWMADKSVHAPGRLENLKELVRAMAEFENLEEFLDHVSLVMDTDNTAADAMVNIMTLHGAKGLEFDTVFLPGWEEGVFPNQMAIDENGYAGLEEERRLAYVGLTRARKRAIVLYAANRTVHGQWQSNIPSRFVDELPEDHTERAEAAGYGFVQDDGTLWQIAMNRPAYGGRQSNYHRVIAARSQRFDDGGEIFVPVGKGQSIPEIGSRVFHQKFGYGVVKRIDGSKLDIAFDKSGQKKVMADFVEPA
ncbi:MAG: UvrD-helicase domain-containing protein [Rhodospirillales bacterium]|nr:UvrD-helicase domain-containing protein [Rhodospirillales bacterium]